jgi:phospholipid transport system substrate-binding protein
MLINEIEIMNSIKRFIAKSLLFTAVLIGLTAQAQAMKSPDVVVKETVDTMVSKLQSNRALYKSNNQALYDMLNAVLIPALHVERMADLILGKEYSRSSSATQKSAFVEEFKTFLLQSYATGLLNASGEEKVVYEPIKLKPGADKVQVKAMLISSSGEKYPITLSMSNRKDTKWRAYNLDVAGINFIRTYRSSFAQTLQEKGIDGLVADLRAKNAR